MCVGGLSATVFSLSVSRETSGESVTAQQRYVRLRGIDALEEVPPGSVAGVYIRLVDDGG
jgi:hypothetical protein